MRAEYDFSKAKRGAPLPTKGKTRITIYIDDTVLDEFRSRAEKGGSGYQTMMNDALKAYLAETDQRPLTESVLRRVIREELPRSARLTKRSSGRSKTRAAER
jgi:metal-responsive CopG/Arc/MetJ family transcriptional regulator